MRILSLGAGVQSSYLAIKHYLNYDFAIFADTGHEREETYQYLKFLKNFLKDKLEIKQIKRRPDLKTRQLTIKTSKEGKQYTNRLIPFYLNGRQVQTRGCSIEFKIRPIQKYLRSLGARKRNPFELHLGISKDEAHRAKDSRVSYLINRFPLLEENISREECIEFFKREGLPIPERSHCYFCPFQSLATWKSLKPRDLEKAAKFEAELNKIHREIGKGNVFLTRFQKPLMEVTLDSEDKTEIFPISKKFANHCIQCEG